MKKKLFGFLAGIALCLIGATSALAQQTWYHKATATYQDLGGTVQNVDVYFGIQTYFNDVINQNQGAITSIQFRTKPNVPEGKAIRIEIPNGRVAIYNSMDDADSGVNPNHHTITGIRKLSAGLYDDLPRINFPALYELVISPSIQNIQARLQDIENTKIQSLTIRSSNLKEIPDQMCPGCTGLTTLTFEEGCKVGRIGKIAFNNCGFTSLTIPTNIDLIDNEAFEWNKELTQVTFKSRNSDAPQMVIDTLAFGKCAKLTSVTFERGVKIIGAESFGQSPFTTSISFPEGLEEIHSNAFAAVKIVGDLVLPNSLKILGHQPWGAPKSVDEPNWIFYNGIRIPENLQRIGNFSFMGSRKEQKDFVIPSSVTHLGANCFATAPLTGNLTIPSSVTSMGNAVFLYCGGLEYVTFEANSTISVGERQFRECKNLKYVDMREVDSPNLLASLKGAKVKRSLSTGTNPNSVFSGMSDYTLVYLPKNATYETKSEFMEADQVNFIMKTAENKYRTDRFKAIDNSGDYQQLYLRPKVKEQMNQDATTRAELEALENLCPYNARGCDYIIPQEFTADEASYERTFTPNTLSLYTISLPYGGATLPAGLRAYKLVRSTELAGSLNNKGVWFASLDDSRLTNKTENEAQGKLEDNHPYVICFENTTLSSSYKFNASNVIVRNVANTDTPADTSLWRFVSTNTNVYNEKASTDRLYTLNGANKKWIPIKNSNSAGFLHSFRGALKYLGEGQPKSIPAFLGENQATGIDNEIEAEVPATTTIYTIDGRLVNESFDNLAPGLYIINGEKVVKP